jgi:restriction endonuclease S subunit
MTLPIPIPPIERQQEIIEYCDNNNTLIKQLEKEIEDNKKQAYQFITSIIKKNKKDEIHTNNVIIKRKKINTPPENLILS